MRGVLLPSLGERTMARRWGRGDWGGACGEHERKGISLGIYG